MKYSNFLLIYISYIISYIKAAKNEFSMINCPSGYLALTQYSCDQDNVFMPQSKCKTGEGCPTSWVCSLKDEPKCPSLVQCPNDYRYRCPDNTCVQNVEDCPNYLACPPFLPVRCPNGDCRKAIEDCPSTIYCSDSGFLCNDGSCRITPDSCIKSTLETTCVDKSLVRCSDGTCQSSSQLCATPVTCPKDRVLSYLGKCEKKNVEAGTNKEFCKSEQVLCNFDYSCVSNIESCPTGIICPSDRPVKCWDMSCVSTLDSCPAFQECGSGMKSCADGSCVSEKGECGTHITCSKDAPFRCFDNTCRSNPKDCPQQNSCPSNAPILCWDGRCLSDRSECIPPEKCPTNAPVRCPDGLCKSSINECSMILGCPNGFSMCEDGTCRQKLAYCEEQKCGINFPYKCKNGLCVSSEEFCDKDNGCPFNKPYKCKNGACVDNQTICYEQEYNVNDTCPDGSIQSVCPLANGCPVDNPLLCANGECINPKKANCSIPSCPSETPYRCTDGKCVLSSSYCPLVNSVRNEHNLLYCANGREANNFEECKILIPCPDSYVRCDDGSCRDSKEHCPKATAKQTCPKGKEYRCDDGTCAENYEKCTNKQGCPINSGSRCPSSGLCANTTNECTQYESKFHLSNGCTAKTPIRCLSGKCVKNSNDCDPGNGCTDPSKPFPCPNGECRESARQCREEGQIDDCPHECPYQNFIKCVEFNKCINDFNCPLATPFRCPDGTCKRYPSRIGNSTYDQNACEIGIKCPDYKPFLCADGQCVEKKSFCISHSKCPNDAREVCFDRTCVSNKDNCKEKCPAKNPILCPNSNCVSSLFDCRENACPVKSPFKCYSGPCKEAPYECLVKEKYNIFESLCDKENEVTCYDGSCRMSHEDCPIYEGCNYLTYPYKCPNGNCVENSNLCEKTIIDIEYEECIKGGEGEEGKEKEDKPTKKCIHNRICEKGETLCQDGICRKECPNFNGCPFDKPLLCSTGKCVKDEDECAGESNCASISAPFKCIDGSCKSSIKECSSPLKGFGSTNIKLSSFLNFDITSDIVLGENNLPIATVYIPTNALGTKSDHSDIEGQIHFKSVPQNILRDTIAHYDITRKEDVQKVFPYGDPNSSNTLVYEYSVLSTVVEVKLVDDSTIIKNNLLLTLMYDFPEITNSTSQNTEDVLFKDLDGLEDVCLGKLSGNEWKCVEEIPEVKKTDRYYLQCAIKEPGIYAVILSPVTNNKLLTVKEYFFIKYIKAIGIIILIAVIVISLGTYIFYRQYRYRGKYKEARNEAEIYAKEMEELSNASASVLGQTIGDAKEGIVFTDNPAFKKVKNEELSKRVLELERIYYQTAKNLRTVEKNNTALQERLNQLKKDYEEVVRLKELENNLVVKDVNPDKN